MPTVEFEPAIPASERPQTHALNTAASIGRVNNSNYKLHVRFAISIQLQYNNGHVYE
jgi:hypothetical protein